MMDLIAGSPRIMTEDARPFHTLWSPEEVAADKKAFRKTSRRQYKHYMKTGRIEDFNRSQKMMTNWSFD